jgi:D-alanine transaminase/branched-chain amino acid aminotransferase
MNYYCYAHFAGKTPSIIRRSEIKMGIDDLVMLRGYAVFDFMRTYSGVPFRIDDYVERFESSATEMKLKMPLSRKKISSIVQELLYQNSIGQDSKTQNAGIRFLLTGRYLLDAHLPDIKPNLFILIEELPPYPKGWLTKGIKLMLHQHAREMAGVKTTNYITAIHLSEERKKHRAQDTLYHDGKQLLETTRNNFFVFKHNTLLTSSHHILKGITRKTVLELATKKFTVEVRPLELKELPSFTEAFVTGTTLGIIPVVKIDETILAKGKPGANTKELIRMFDECVRGDYFNKTK